MEAVVYSYFHFGGVIKISRIDFSIQTNYSVTAFFSITVLIIFYGLADFFFLPLRMFSLAPISNLTFLLYIISLKSHDKSIIFKSVLCVFLTVMAHRRTSNKFCKRDR